jgi:hypothetical protein
MIIFHGNYTYVCLRDYYLYNISVMVICEYLAITDGIFLKCGVKIYDSHANCRRLGRHVLEIGLTWMYC